MASRWIDLAVSARLAEVEKGPDGRPRWKAGTDTELIAVGGVWDRKKRRYDPEKTPKRVLIVRFHRGQWESARWICEWLRRWAENDWEGVERVWSLMLYGARASGKTHDAIQLFVLFCVLCPRAITWAVSATVETGEELDAGFASAIPKEWRKRKPSKNGRSVTYHFANGSKIFLKSGTKGGRLKAGRVDLVLINEAQDQKKLGYTKVRPRIADNGGLAVLTANPPDTVVGEWVDEHLDKALAGEIDGIAFVLDPLLNPWINHAAFLSSAKEFDKATADRELRGLRAPIGDVVFDEWRDHLHWKDPPPHLVDVTDVTLRKLLGAGFSDIVGADFQKSPFMSGRHLRIYVDPLEPDRPLLWVLGEADVKGNEFKLLDVLSSTGIVHGKIGLGLDGASTGVIFDASARYQNGAHDVGKTSELAFRSRDWDHLFNPQQHSDKNPDVGERMKSGNSLLAAGRLFVARRCEATAEAFRKYENLNGRANRKSKYAHIIDAVTYVCYRLFGVPELKTEGLVYHAASGLTRTDEMRERRRDFDDNDDGPRLSRRSEMAW